MSKLRALVPVLLATGFGVLNGYIVFQPAYQDLEAKKIQKLEASKAADLGPGLKVVPIPATDSPSTGSTAPGASSIPSDETPQTWTRTVWAWYTSSPTTTPTNNTKNETKDS